MDKQMQNFFDEALGRTAFPKNATQGHRVYEALVQHRFHEVITSAFPLLSRHTDENVLEKAIKAFIQHAPSTPYIWQVPFFFWKFAQTQKLLCADYVDDLLWYEWSEIELMMEVFHPLRSSIFSWQNDWVAHSSLRIRALSYRVFESNLETKGEWFLLAWYDTRVHAVLYKEVGEVVFRFLELLEEYSFQESLQRIIHEAQSDQASLEAYLNDAFVILAHEGIIQPKDLS